MHADEMQIVVIGGGKMGEAIVAGWLACDTGPAAGIIPNRVVVVDPGSEKRAHLERTLGVTCVPQVAAVGSLDGLERVDVVVLAVKPQVMPDVLKEIADVAILGGTAGAGAHVPLFVSIAAGLTTEGLSAGLPDGAHLVRVMPNMPLMIGAGASGVCAGAAASEEELCFVADLFGCLGRAVIVDECDMDTVCAVSGSGPAYVAAMVEALRDAAVSQGLEADLAETLALQTVLGTARLISETDLTPQTAREAVCSPGGTTLAALDAMDEAGFAQVFAAGVEAAITRSKELAQCS